MLIHRKTMGALESVWTGQYKRAPDGTQIPVERCARLADFPELDPADWWELDSGSPLARKVRKHYPWLTPVIGPAGELLDVEPIPDEWARERAEQEAAQSAALDRLAAQRGYKRRGRVRPLGLLPLGGTGQEA